ncbi:MAG: PDZ domain-containing protein [Firmicutes bacterium]|nr:PDZ domain-containing protein [Bacillota bacterium]
MKKLRKLIIICLIGAILFFTRTNYLIIRPGSAEDLSRFVSVPGQEAENQGTFYMVTVSQQKASPAMLLYGLLNPIIDIRHSHTVIPPEMDPQDYQRLMQRWMEESQNLAKVVALRRLGYDVAVESDGVEVVEIGENSPAKGLLLPGDLIVQVDHEPVYLADELVERVQARPIGDPVKLTIKRNGELKQLEIATTNHSEEPDKAGILIYIQTKNWRPQLPFEIEINVGRITGSSAGLMFVLEILDQLDARQLTGGKKIAGTGTINLQEEVGPIGGVRQKVRAAEKAGAEYFFVPQKNYQEAKTAARTIKLVPVETLDDALQFLEKLADEN